MPDTKIAGVSAGSAMAELLRDVAAREAGRATGEMVNYALKGDKKKQEGDNDEQED